MDRHTPDENQSPSGVGVIRDLMPSTIETAVDAAEDLPHFVISTPPRCKRQYKMIWVGFGSNIENHFGHSYVIKYYKMLII